MELERVGTVTMRHRTRHVLRQIDDCNCFKWALLNTHAASDTQLFTDEANRRGGFDLNTNLAYFITGTGFGAFLSALLWFTLIWVDNGDSELSVV